MQSDDVYVRMGPRVARTGQVALRLRVQPAEAPAFETSWAVDCGNVDAGLGPVDRDGMRHIAWTIAQAIDSALARDGRPGHYFIQRMLLDIAARELCGGDWEAAIREQLPWPMGVARFTNVSDDRALQPFTLPMRMLEVAAGSDLDVRIPESASRYFQHMLAQRLANEDLAGIVRGSGGDIVHLAVIGRPLDGLEAGLSIEGGDSDATPPVDARTLQRALAACGARLLVLQGVTPASYEPLLRFAHRVQAAGGPATVVFDGAPAAMFESLYMNIVHDSPLRQGWFGGTSPGTRLALLHRVGGDEALRISPMADQLASAARRGLARIEAMTAVAAYRSTWAGATLGIAPVIDESREAALALDELANTQRALAERVYHYNRESGAWIPLERDVRAQADTARHVAALERGLSRVVNVGFANDREGFTGDRALRAGTRHELWVQVGRRAGWSAIDGDAAFPDEVFGRQFAEGGTELRVVVFASAFEVDTPDRPLWIAPPPADSALLRFDLRAPMTPGPHRLRVCLYHRQNLVQSILVRVRVIDGEDLATDEPGVRAELEFRLSTSLDNLDRLPDRTVNLLTNASDDGSHTFAIVGRGLATTFDFGEGEMRAAVDEARRALFEIAADTGTNPPTYRFDEGNRTSVARFAEDAIKLAQLGYQLYWKIVLGKRPAFEDALTAALGPGQATIQVAAVKSARYVFPWAVVYDHPLVLGPATLCPEFAAALASRAPLATQRCLVQGCPHRGTTDIVCPSGFWGFKHLIEQPLSSPDDESGPQELVLDIDGGPAGSEPPALMVVSRELSQVDAHERELRSANAFRYRVRDTKTELGLDMRMAPPATAVYYFYCHGGRNRQRTWLGIGEKEQLVASDLQAWRVDWDAGHPLVFINGCHTVDLTPDDLLSFNQVFARCRAAGVIGTEISIPEGLARAFAAGFLARFGAGVKAGIALREQRLELLAGGNLLGLAYTPYCSGELQIVRH